MRSTATGDEYIYGWNKFYLHDVDATRRKRARVDLARTHAMAALLDAPPAVARGTPRADAPSRTHYGRVFDVSFCPWDARLFATAGEDETARVWRDDSRSPRGGRGVSSHGVCRGHKDEVVRVAWHPTMKLLATGSADGAVGVWRVAQPGMERAASAHDPDAGSVARVDVLGGHPGEVYGLSFVGDGGGGGPVLAAAAGTDLHLWDLESASLLSRVAPAAAANQPAPEPSPSSASASASASSSPTPERWRPGYLFSLASDAGARGLLASACSDGTVKLWGHDSPARAAVPVASLPLHPDGLCCATAFVRGGDVLASASTDGTLIFTDVRTLAPTRRVKSPCPLMGIAAVPGGDGSWLAMVGADGRTRVVSATGAGAKTLPAFEADAAATTTTSMLCVGADATGERVAAAGHAPEAAAPMRGFGSIAAGPLGGKKNPTPAPVRVWDAKTSDPTS